MDIDVGEEWFRIANGLNLFINNPEDRFSRDMARIVYK